MARLKGIAHGLLGTFASRNNDIDGYWGLGILRLHAEGVHLSELTIDLLSQEQILVPYSPLAITRKKYHRWLTDALTKAGMEVGQLKSAKIKVMFSTFDEFPNTIRDTRGQPYLCTVELTGVNGVTYTASKLGCCALHDPDKDRRSTRVAELP
jgi:hypothetical protein